MTNWSYPEKWQQFALDGACADSAETPQVTVAQGKCPVAPLLWADA
jgi:hypothetical protein